MNARTRESGQEGSVSLSGLAVIGACALVLGLAVHAVRAGDPAPVTGAADPMTIEGQLQLEHAFGRKHTPSSLIIPDQQIPLRFSHKKHVDLVKCVECHTTVTNSLRAKDRNLPAEATCLDCHDHVAAAKGQPTDPPASCSTCHPGFEPKWKPGADFTDTKQVEVYPEPIVFPDPNLKFNHKVHIQEGVACERCHQNMGVIDLATRENALPVMGTCLDCHDGNDGGKHPNSGAPNACKTCHLTNPDGRIDTELPAGKLEPEGWYFMDAHDDRWLESHRAVATLGENGCDSCHTQKECLDCHNGVKKPLKVHPNNWTLSHTIPARRNDPDCSSCHRSQTFCVDCHTATKVVKGGGSDFDTATRRFHPAGWVEKRDLLTENGPVSGAPFPGIRGSSHHSFEAQRNIRACASCHTEQTCIACHGEMDVAGRAYFRINPHPQSWTRTGDCVRVRNKNERVCYKCHEATEQAMRCGAGP